MKCLAGAPRPPALLGGPKHWDGALEGSGP